jgi:hypothetical protein
VGIVLFDQRQQLGRVFVAGGGERRGGLSARRQFRQLIGRYRQQLARPVAQVHQPLDQAQALDLRCRIAAFAIAVALGSRESRSGVPTCAGRPWTILCRVRRRRC